MNNPQFDTIIIGAGIAGLTAAKVLKAAGRKVAILESADAVGGRVRTDNFNGFLLDRGFQVLLTGYPEAKNFLDYKALNLRSFSPGSIILNSSGIDEIGDPLREFGSLFRTLKSSAGSFTDKLRLLLLRMKLSSNSIEEIFSKPEMTSLQYLRTAGFSERIISNFFSPFLSGIYLEQKLNTSSRMFEFVFKMFSEADTAIPERGMGMISEQLASRLTKEELILNEKVSSIIGSKVETVSGKIYEAANILIATSADCIPLPFQAKNIEKKSVTCLYFSAERSPYTKSLIALNANPDRFVNSLSVMSNVSSAYAPAGKSLISVSLSDSQLFTKPELLELKIKEELKFWYPDCLSWEYLKTYHIPYALPDNKHVKNEIQSSCLRINDSLFICGDHLLNGSINAAMKSGRLASESILSK
ncbi:MAG: NAD(P)/FAD-dependent oxidoreductase [Sphingobacterium thalpophilum]